MTADLLDNVAALPERAYIGALLHLRGQEARDALARVQVTDLADPQLRAILEALLALGQDGHDPDPALVVPRMLELGLVTRDKSGLAAGLVVDLLTEVPAPPCWSAYAAQVLRESARRTIRETAERMLQVSDGPDLVTALRVMNDGLGQVALAVNRAIVGVTS